MADAVIVAAVRTPIGRAHKGSLSACRADDLAAGVVRALLAAVPALTGDDLDDLIMGCGSPGGEQGWNLARMVALLLGFDRLPGTTVTRHCASSLQSTRMAFHAIRAGEGSAFLSVGVETASRYRYGNSESSGEPNPVYAAAGQRSAAARAAGEYRWTDPRDSGSRPDAYLNMIQTAEYVAALKGVSRRDMDAFALESHRRAVAASDAGHWEHEIAPVTLPDGTVVSTDDGPRRTSTMAKLATLPPILGERGTVTAGNSCPTNDGAAALLIMSDVRARELGLRPIARIVATGVSALSPEIMGLGPIEASRQTLARAGMSIRDVDLVEINEAFAAQVIACSRELGIDDDRLNVWGGGIALGHPPGMTGARIACTLSNALRVRDASIGLMTMCIGGGQGMAMILERL